MVTRSMGPGAGFGWLSKGIGMIFRHPRPMLGGAGFAILILIIPMLVTVPMQLSQLHAGTPQDPSMTYWIMALYALLGLLFMPLYAGYMQVIDAASRGLPARARDIFKPYRQGREAGRLIGYGVANLIVYNTLLGIIIVATGGTVGHWYMHLIAAQANHQPVPALPHGFGTVLALLVVLILFTTGFYAISLGQVSLRRRSVLGAVGDGILGALKNVLPLLVFALSAMLAGIVAILALFVVALVIGLIGALVGPYLVLVLVIPLYISMMLILMAAMFGVAYFMWHDVCGEDAVPTESPAIIA